ncbi:hypothetical protein [Planctomycetes bacterium K23_9]|uniref:General secretion pathway protein M n=1 Tax=Stieleria marina TaxID=1930275 RepID=A0A517NNW2_9BACT|nr:hypothetical protein K239x_07590 [Planctomycetes bacterium K23_9]
MNQTLGQQKLRHPLTLFTVLLVAGTLAVAFFYQGYASAVRADQKAQTDLSRVEELAKNMAAAKARPRLAALEVEPPDRISRRVNEALEAAEISPESLLSIDPQPVSRIGRSDYQNRATQIVLQEVTLKQLVEFTRSLRDEADGMDTRDLSLTPRTSNSVNEEFWDVRLTLTQRIFSPISDS